MTQKETLNFANFHVVKSVPSAPGHSQKRELSPGAAACQTSRNYKLKYVNSVSCVTQLCPVQPVANAPNVAQNLPVGARLQSFWKTWLNLGAGPKVVQILREGYSLPFRIRPQLTIPYSHKPVCQSPQEQLPVGGITSAYRQKSGRKGSKSEIPRVFQPTIFSPKTQQQMEANPGPKQFKRFPQSGKVQDGDTGNHQNIPPARRVGHLSRLQRCLLSHTDTGTIQKISTFSCPGPDLPVQSIAFRPVHSAHGVHCISQRGETDGHTQGYKNPPVPRRLVGESQISTPLSPTHPTPGQDVPGPRLAGESREIRTGTQTSIRLRRLPVRPQVRPGQTDSGPVARPSRQDTSTSITTDLSGPTAHVLDRPPHSHRKTGSPRPTTHETHTVAPQKQLEGTRISGEDYPSTEVPAPALTMVARRRQGASRPTFTPSKTCSANFYRHIKRRVGRSLKRVHYKGVLVDTGKQAAHKPSRTKSSFPSVERVPRSLCRKK